MFDIISKEEYWRWIQEGVVQSPEGRWVKHMKSIHSSLSILTPFKRLSLRISNCLKPQRPYELKDVQDAFLMSRLKGINGATILEVGGGNSRILPNLSPINECWTVDRFEGKGRGPIYAPKIKGVRTVCAYMGEFSSELESNYFDFVISVSVVEHVSLDTLDTFFKDCARVLKPGGHMIHAIDTYLFDSHDHSLSQPFQERIQAYLNFANRLDMGIKLLEEPNIDQDIQFSCRFASLPDNVLHEWELMRPSIKRATGQVVSIKAEWIKKSQMH